MRNISSKILIFLLFLSVLTDCRCFRKPKDVSDRADESEKKANDISKFHSDPAIRDMVFGTRFSEIARRFGDTVFEQTYTLEISSGKQKIELTNKDLIEQAKNGDYHIKVDNSAGKIMEVYYIDKKLYVSMDGRKFFLHADDLVEARAKKEGIYSQVNTFLKTYSVFIKFVPDGEEERDGIRFIRFRTEINSKPEKSEALRLYSLEEINGYVLIDRRSGGLVSADIKGIIKYEKESKKALSKFSIRSDIYKSKVPFLFKLPEVGTEPQKLRIEKDLLERLEKMEENFGTEKEEDQEDPNR